MSGWRYAFPVLVQIAEAGERGISKNNLVQKYSFKELTAAMHDYVDNGYIVIIPITDETTALKDATYKITELGIQYIDQCRMLFEEEVGDQATDQIAEECRHNFFTKKWLIDNIVEIMVGIIATVIGGIILAHLL